MKNNTIDSKIILISGVVSLCVSLYLINKKPILKPKQTYFRKNTPFVPNTIEAICLDEIGIRFTDQINNCTIYIPYDYSTAPTEINDPNVKAQIKLGVPYMDQFAAKDGIWKNLSLIYSRESIVKSKIFPQTWKLSDKDDINNYFNNSDIYKDKLLIAKTNQQRQHNILLMQGVIPLEFWQRLINNKYVVVQELLDNPVLSDGRKTNIRIYVAITHTINGVRIFIYDNGFMYYTPEKFAYEPELSKVITTGYIDRKVYQENPLSIREFFRNDDQAYLNTMNRCADIIKICTNCVLKNWKTPLNFTSQDQKYAQLFGADFQPNQDGSVTLMEFNKGCSLQIMDERDKEIKRNMFKEFMDCIVLENQKTSNWIEIKE